MRKKVLQIGFLVVCMCLCLSVSVGILFAGPSQAGANEQLSEFPPLLTEDESVNAQFLSQLSDWFRDRFFLRQELISLDHWVSAHIFGTSGDEGVILGSDGWLYYGDTLVDYTGTAPMSDRELFSAANNLSLMAQYCRENDREFLFVIAPNKNSLYSENMPDYGVQAELTNASRLLSLLDRMEVETADLFTAFRQESATLYFAHDSHWNSMGAALGADLINAAFGVESSYYSGDFSKTAAHSGDLYTMLYPAFTDPEEDYVYGGQLDYSFATAATRPDAIVLNTESDGQGTLLAYRDSFGNLLFPYLADTYAAARFSRSVSYDLTYESDYVLVELVERNLRYLTENLPVMPAPQAQTNLPDAASGTVQTVASSKGKLLQIKGELPGVDTDSSVYVVCGGTTYEAFCLGKSGFGICMPPECAPEYVVCTADGEPVMYKIEIQ